MNDTKRVVEFALRNPGWQTYSKDKRTVTAVCAASNLRLIQLNEYEQFRVIEENARRYLEQS